MNVAPAHTARAVARWLLAAFLATAGTAHFAATEAFLAQVPRWMPWRTGVVLVSGAVEIGLAAALVAVPRRRVVVGWLIAGFFVMVLPGNINQALVGADAFGLQTDRGRWIRLGFQPLLVAWALWSTGAWYSWRRSRRSSAAPATDRPSDEAA